MCGCLHTRIHVYEVYIVSSLSSESQFMSSTKCINILHYDLHECNLRFSR